MLDGSVGDGAMTDVPYGVPFTCYISMSDVHDRDDDGRRAMCVMRWAESHIQRTI